jgi:hypothetical protein
MFTEAEPEERVSKFTAFLGASVLSREVLSDSTDRASYFACCKAAGNLLLDPDTGLKLKTTPGPARSSGCLFASELASLAQVRPTALTLVFDKSVARGDERRQTEGKLAYFASQQLYAFAYVSHACFLALSQDEKLVRRAYDRILQESRLPGDRLSRSWSAS